MMDTFKLTTYVQGKVAECKGTCNIFIIHVLGSEVNRGESQVLTPLGYVYVRHNTTVQ